MKSRLVWKKYGHRCFDVAIKFFEKPVAIIVTRSVIFQFQIMQPRNLIGEVPFFFSIVRTVSHLWLSSWATWHADTSEFSSACSVTLVWSSSETVCGLPNLSAVVSSECILHLESFNDSFHCSHVRHIMKSLFVLPEGGLVRIWTKIMFKWRPVIREYSVFSVDQTFFFKFYTCWEF